MRIVRTDPGKLRTWSCETWLGLLFLPTFWFLLWLSTLLPPSTVPSCLLFHVAGIPCPTCGSFRAVRQLLHGQPFAAWRLQPLVTTVLLLSLAYVCFSAVVVVFGFPRMSLRLERSAERWWLVAVAALLTGLNWWYLLNSLPC